MGRSRHDRHQVPFPTDVLVHIGFCIYEQLCSQRGADDGTGESQAVAEGILQHIVMGPVNSTSCNHGEMEFHVVLFARMTTTDTLQD